MTKSKGGDIIIAKLIDKLIYRLTRKPKGYKCVNNPPKTSLEKMLRPQDARQVQYNEWLKYHRRKPPQKTPTSAIRKLAIPYRQRTQLPTLEQIRRSLEKKKQQPVQKNKKSQKKFKKHERSLISELKKNRVKFTEEDIIFITTDRTKQTIWLEKGTPSSGFEHIKIRHTQDFKNKYHVDEEMIPDFLKKVVENGEIVENTFRMNKGREQIKRVYLYKNKYYVLTALGTNGFIVSAYPDERKEKND